MDYTRVTATPVATTKTASAVSSATSATSAKEVHGIDFLSTLEVAEEIEVKVPFRVVMKYEHITDKNGAITGWKNVKFFTSKLANASFEVCPVFEPGTIVDGAIGEEGELVVSCAKQDDMFKVTMENNGFRRIEFRARPKFVSFNGHKAVKFAEAKEVMVSLADLAKSLHAANKPVKASK